MCQPERDYFAGLYGNWEGRIEHLEKTRYLLLGAEIAVLTFALNAVLLNQPARFDTTGLLLLHAVAAVFAMVIARLVENVSRGAHTAATELMLLEYRMGVVQQGLGYYARRAGRRRHAFRLLPVAGDLLSVIFIAASLLYQLLEGRYHPSSVPLFLLLLVLASALGFMSYARSEAMFEHKDSLDRWCGQNAEAVADGSAAERLVEQKRPLPANGPYSAFLGWLRGS